MTNIDAYALGLELAETFATNEPDPILERLLALISEVKDEPAKRGVVTMFVKP